MFEKELFEYIKANFLENLPSLWQNVSIFFGEAPEAQKAPYIVMYPLNPNGTRQVLCNNDNYTDGRVSIQFNIYDKDYSNAFYLGRELSKFLADIEYLPNYHVLLNNHENIRGFPDISNGLCLETVTRYFTYTEYSPVEYFNLVCKLGVLTVLNNIKLAVN